MLGFRVWYFDKMWYKENSKVVMNSSGELCEIYQGGACPYSPNSELYPSAPIPMQSTGIRSQGYLIENHSYEFIYEGDVVQIDCEAIKHNYTFLVENIPQFYSMLPGNGINFFIKILGNKWENPELLEKIEC